MMKKELLFAVRAMAKEAKTNLDAAVKVATAKFDCCQRGRGRGLQGQSAGERAAIAESITTARRRMPRQ